MALSSVIHRASKMMKFRPPPASAHSTLIGPNRLSSTSRIFSTRTVTKIIPSSYADPNGNSGNEDRLNVSNTHQVTNQTPALGGAAAAAGGAPANFFLDDAALGDALRALLPEEEGPAAAAAAGLRARTLNHLQNLGREVASEDTQKWAEQANSNPPKLHQYDRHGYRVDQVEFHDSYHALLTMGVEHEVACFAWKHEEPGALTVRAALYHLMGQADPGACCPLAMTSAATPLLREHEVWGDWRRLQSRTYDPRDLPLFEKSGATLGVAMTEKQGGSDARANTTTAKPLRPERRANGEGYLLRGHKWFCSNPSGDGIITLAQTEKGPSAFLVPRWLPDGSRNTGLRIERLKDKLGDRSNATGEIEFHNAFGILLGEEGEGLTHVMGVVHLNRLDCAVGVAAQMRAGLRQALHHAHHREAFGEKLVAQPLMAAVLADLAAESEAATWLALHTAKAHDDGFFNPEVQAYSRVAVPLAKYALAKRQPAFAAEALECLGGNGYSLQFPQARAFAQAPYNALWEGTSNVMCLDVLRALRADPAAAELLRAELAAARGLDPRADAAAAAARVALRLALGEEEGGGARKGEARARHLADHLATALQCSIMLRYADPMVTEVFLSRLEMRAGTSYGCVVDDSLLSKVIQRASLMIN